MYADVIKYSFILLDLYGSECFFITTNRFHYLLENNYVLVLENGKHNRQQIDIKL